MEAPQSPIHMVDLVGQYNQIKTEIDKGINEVLTTGRFIQGPVVRAFESELAEYLGVKHVIPCANGTDALQIALMALGLVPGDEVIVPAFTYAATAEVIGLLNLQPVMVDVEPDSFNTSVELIEGHISERTKAIVPVHLYGQCCDMGALKELAIKHDLKIVEDGAQSIGASILSDGKWSSSGTIGDIGCTSFFPSKNLGCYGDGGALFTNDDDLAQRIRMIANHGQARKYYHSVIGVNSRLDAMQAAILRVKLRHLDTYCDSRRKVADRYDQAFEGHSSLSTPHRVDHSSHVFHQYTLKVASGQRDSLKSYLLEAGVPSMIYYPLPLYKQEAYAPYFNGVPLPHTEALCASVLSLPIHTEMSDKVQDYIIHKVITYFDDNPSI